MGKGERSRLTLERGRWYACEFIGDEFDIDKCHYSPIKVLDIRAGGRGVRGFTLDFYHAAYPEGVRDKVYDLRMIERGRTVLLAKSIDHDPSRILQIYDVSTDWLIRHCNVEIGRPNDADPQAWLDFNA